MELADGDPLHPRRPNNHREDRPGLADPSLPLDPHGEPPFISRDRRNPTLARTEEGEDTGDWSNLTSGPKGPTVSDQPRRHVF